MHTTASESPITLLQERKRGLVADFVKGREPHFVEHHAWILDDYFRESVAGSLTGPRMRVERNPFAVIALGGYGRKEQYLYSDVDVLVLFEKKIPAEAKGLVREIFYPLWDIGLDVGYAIRSLKECIALAGQDFEVMTSLLDARLICGISSLYLELSTLLYGRVLPRRSRAYLDWLSGRNLARHSRFGDAAHLLEPNIKDGLGGLRDYHAMLWAARVMCDIGEPREIEFRGYLSREEIQSLTETVSFISTVRNWLHYLSKRKCDKLYFDHQARLAVVLGFKAQDGQRAVERFLGKLHGHMELLKQCHLMFLNRAISMGGKPARSKKTRRRITPGIVIVRDALDFESPEVVLGKPHLLMKIFEKSAALGLPLSVEASRLVREFLYLADDFRDSQRVVKSFQKILSSPPGAVDVLDEMLNTGMLAALIPEMKTIVNRIQYDEYHVYPVDKHSVHVVEKLREFQNAQNGGDKGFYRRLLGEIERPELLLWSALLHDLGKGRHRKDHARHGARLAESILERMGFVDDEIDTVSFLVRNHILLIETATRRDINDEKIVVQCARKCRDTERLKMLYLLTVADCGATGPKAWNDWTAMLLRALFFKVHHVLENGELATPESAEVVRKKKRLVFRGAAASMPREELESLFDQMSPRYLLYTPVREIIKHIELYRGMGEKPFVLQVGMSPEGNYRTATICAHDFAGLFSRIAGVLTLNSLDILSARIYTWRNQIALDIFDVKAPPDAFREDETWARVEKDLVSALKGDLALDSVLEQKMKAYWPVRRAIGRKPDKVVVDNETSDFHTIVEVYTHDYPGLLYKLTNAFYMGELDVWVAKIATKVDQVVDVFYIRHFDGRKLTDPNEIAELKEAIGRVLTHGLSGDAVKLPRARVRSVSPPGVPGGCEEGK